MPAAIKKQTETQVTLSVSLSATELEPIVRQSMNRLRRNLKVAGFRPGKAPDHVVERELGAQAVQGEVLEAATQQSYVQAVQEHKLVTIGNPEVSLEKFVPYSQLEYSAVVDVLPPVKLADYKQLKLDRPTVEVGNDEIAAVVEDLRKQLAEREVVERPAAVGDAVTFDFEGRKNGELVEGASAKSHELVLGSGSFVPGFEEALLGLKSGDHKEFEVTFPKDYQQPSLAGQPVKFKVTVHQVKEVRLPAADAGLASQVGPFKTIEDLQADVKARLTAEKDEKAQREFEQAVIDRLVAGSKLTLPPKLVHDQQHRLKHELEDNLRYSGLDMAKYLEMQGKTAEQLETELQPQAEKRVATGLILREVAKEEGLQVTTEEVEQELERLRQAYQDAQAQAELAKPEFKADLANHLLLSKTLAKIVEYVQGK